MVKGERIMPVPGGEITSTETWSEGGDNNQAVEEAAQSEVQEEVNATESAVVEGGSETDSDLQ
jgi:hypothetical protein